MVAAEFTPWWQGALIAIDVVIGAATVGCAVMFVLYKVNVLGKKEEKV